MKYYYKCIQPFDKLHKDLKRLALRHGSLIVYEDPNAMVLRDSAWKQLGNVELLSECKRTPIMEAYYVDPGRHLRWKRIKL
jgi:hypothetical protein